ncbi:SpaA isopeptide-forming pilin-related protein (plasmid) [Lactococcus garvieae]|uniref:SpaA isopeptide-forming pilin-related protein n=1 Tax=Lactococcus garvieae TaxID=1363 RepID=UPI0030CB8B29
MKTKKYFGALALSLLLTPYAGGFTACAQTSSSEEMPPTSSEQQEAPPSTQEEGTKEQSTSSSKEEQNVESKSLESTSKPFVDPRIGIAPADLTLNSSKVNVIDDNNSSTWVPQNFFHDIDMSQVTLDPQWSSADAHGSDETITGLKYERKHFDPLFSTHASSDKSPAEYVTHTMDSNVWFRNILIDGIAVDLKIHVSGLEQEKFTSDSKVSSVSGLKIELTDQLQGIPALSFGYNMSLTSLNYDLTFYASGTNSPLSFDFQFMYGDQEGAGPTTYPVNTASYEVGEQMTLVDGFDPAQPNKISKFDLFSPNGSIVNGNGFIPDLGADANYQFGTFVYNSNANSKQAVMQKYYKYTKPDGSLGGNVNEFIPLLAQYSFRFSGNNTGTIKNQNAGRRYVRDAFVGAATPQEFTDSYINQLGFSSISPSTVSEPKKYVSDEDETLVTSDTLDSQYEKYSYTLQGSFPYVNYDTYFLKDWKIKDTIPKGISIDDLKAIKAFAYNAILDEEGQEITDKFDYSLTGSDLTITAKPELLNDIETYQKIRNVRFHVPTRITDVTQVETDGSGNIRIPNTLNLSGKYFNDNTFDLDSNEVITTVPQTIKNDLKINKSVNKELVETGKIDDADTSGGKNLQPITYSVDAENSGDTRTLDKVRLLDVLPNVNDGRNSVFNSLGNYQVTALDYLDDQGKPVSDAQIFYKDPSAPFLDSTLDPNTLPEDPTSLGWILYDGDISKLKNTSAILVYAENIEPKKSEHLNVTVEHSENVGALLYNTATANSVINDHLTSNQVQSEIYGRDLKGNVWIDNNYDGLKDAAEQTLDNVPVKLYRTSIADPNFKDELIETSVSGEAYVDASGKSLIKTDSNGDYQFTDLPEGTYVAEFEFDNKQYQVTKKLVNSPSDDASNSKVEEGGNSITSTPDPSSAWNQKGALLSDLPTLTSGTSGLQTLSHNNMGLVASAHLDLFKFKSGTTEGLQGAEFEIYKGKLTDYPTTGNSDPAFVTKAITDAKGELSVDENLFPTNDYTVFEVKAPDGFELYKSPIHFTVNEGDEVIELEVSDETATVLPHTGGSNLSQLLMIGSLAVLILGMIVGGGVYFMKLRKDKSN